MEGGSLRAWFSVPLCKIEELGSHAGPGVAQGDAREADLGLDQHLADVSKEGEKDAISIFEKVEKGLGANLVLPGGESPCGGTPARPALSGRPAWRHACLKGTSP